MPVTAADYAIGLYTSTLIRDNGTLQLGIGSLGDAIVHALKLRHQQNPQYRSLIKDTGIEARHSELIHAVGGLDAFRSEEHTSELQSLMRISYAVFCLKKKNAHETNSDI